MSVSRLKKVGVALGASTYGTAALSFTRGLLCSAFNVTPKGDPQRVSEVRGAMSTVRLTKPVLDYDATLKFPLDTGDATSAGLGDFLASIMGVDTKTGSNPYVHTFTRLDSATPSWLNLYADKDIDAKQYTGFYANSVKLSIKGDAEQIDVEVAGIAKDVSELAGAQSIVFSAAPLLVPSGVSTFTIGGSSVTNFDQVDITIFRDIQRFHPIGNSRVISAAFAKNYGIDVAMQGIQFAAETERDKFIAMTASSLNLILTDSAANYVRFNFPEMFYSSWPDESNINDTDMLRFSCGAIVTDGSTPQVIIQNARSTAYTA
jgi:hypothetical protein